MTSQVGTQQELSSSAKFGGQRHSGSGDIIFFIYNVILADHVIKVLNDFMGKSPLRYVTILPSMMAIGTAAVKL